MYKIEKLPFILVVILLFSVTDFNKLYAVEIHPDIRISKELNFDRTSFKISGNISDTGSDLNEYYFQDEVLNGQLTVGRKYVKSGPGYFSQLMLSDQNTPLNLIMHQGTFKFGSISNNYNMMVAYLDEDVNKQLFHHRVSNSRLINGLEVGFSEAVVTSKEVNPAYYLPVPYLPYYLISYISGLGNDYNYHDDKYIGFDLKYRFDNKLEIYGELLVDEFPQAPGNGNPDKRAHLLGIYYPIDEKTNFRVEYSNVFNYVYLHRFPENRYTYDGKYIGHWLGNDGDVIDLQFGKNLNKADIVNIGLRYLRRGIGDMKTDFGPDHEEKKFLSDITRRELILRIGYTKEINSNLEVKFNSELGKAFSKEQIEDDILNINIGINISL